MNREYQTENPIELDDGFLKIKDGIKRPNRNRLSDLLWLIVGFTGVGGCSYLTNHIEDGTPYHIKYECR
ncbi:MAG: hypothetical protein ACP5N7_02290 [Candidatus Pacearchaeota archaeon]